MAHRLPEELGLQGGELEELLAHRLKEELGEMVAHRLPEGLGLLVGELEELAGGTPAK